MYREGRFMTGEATRSEQLAGLLGAIHSCRNESYALWDHSIAVASTARRLAIAAGHSRHTQRLAYLGGLLHDVGKTATCRMALFKPGPLTAAERKLMNQHPVAGARLVRGLGLAAVTDAVHLHHEMFDGSGYPFGLRGGEIPVIARLVSVADYFEAMTESRPYRPVALGAHEALARIAALAGEGRLDPAVCGLLEFVAGGPARSPSKDFERAVQVFDLTFSSTRGTGRSGRGCRPALPTAPARAGAYG
jgi:putative nucleotidyltransferase with HDIG domain